MRTLSKLRPRLQQRSALARAGRNWPRGFEVCPKKRKTTCWCLRYRSPVNAGRTIFMRIFRGAAPRTSPLWRCSNGVRWRSSHSCPCACEGEGPALNAQRLAEAAKRQRMRQSVQGIWTSGATRTGLESGCSAYPDRQPSEYDKAVTLLTDLRDVAVRRGRTAGFQTELEKIRQVHPPRRASCVDLPRQTCR